MPARKGEINRNANVWIAHPPTRGSYLSSFRGGGGVCIFLVFHVRPFVRSSSASDQAGGRQTRRQVGKGGGKEENIANMVGGSMIDFFLGCVCVQPVKAVLEGG